MFLEIHRKDWIAKRIRLLFADVYNIENKNSMICEEVTIYIFLGDYYHFTRLNFFISVKLLHLESLNSQGI